MAITVGMSEQNRAPLLDVDSYAARCYMLVELGTHTAEYKNQKGGVDVRKVRKVRIGFEIPGKTADFGKGHQEPYVVSRDYTASFGGPNKPSNLLKDVQAWRGKPFTADEIKNGFDLDKLYGVNCYIGIKHEQDRNDPTKVYANVTAILPLPKGTAKIAPVRLRDEQPPKWVIEKIQQGVPDVNNDADPFGPEITNEATA